MDSARANLGPDFAYDAGTLALALAIRDSQVPVPIATEICAQETDTIAPSLRDAGIVGQILAGLCVALVVAFVMVVARGL